MTIKFSNNLYLYFVDNRPTILLFSLRAKYYFKIVILYEPPQTESFQCQRSTAKLEIY